MKPRILIPVGILAVVALGIAARSWMDDRPTNISASGTLEARNISVGSKVGGRVTQVLVREGDWVQPDQLLITFDEAELAAQVKQAQGRVQQARANLSKFEHGSRPEEIAQARANSASSQQAVSQAESELKRAQAEEQNALQSFHRIEGLFREGVVARQALDDAQARLSAAQAQARALQDAISAAQARLRAARASQDLVERGPRVEDIAAARADVVSAEGDLALAQARWVEREVRSPASAAVEVLDLRPGDLLPPNATVARLLESDQLFVMVYVPQTQIGRVQVGQHAQVRVDAFSEESFSATVEQIRQKAEFLPRNVQTSEERQHQVFGVRLRVDNPTRKLRAGVQADVTFTEAR